MVAAQYISLQSAASSGLELCEGLSPQISNGEP